MSPLINTSLQQDVNETPNASAGHDVNSLLS